jgi:AcrR family transcriptional regulator
MPVLAEQGLSDFSLDDIANRADVTRNLLYHYFPRGRPDVAVAVVRLAQRQLTADWLFDENVPLPERMAANYARIAAHAFEPSDSWRVYRRSRAASEPELREAVERFQRLAVTGLSLNQLGTIDPPPLARLGLLGYLAFAETVLDESRESDAPRDQVARILVDTLVATVAAMRAWAT